MRVRPNVTRRSVLRMLGSGSLAAIGVACGEDAPEQPTPPATTGRRDLDVALERARTAAASVTERAPEPGPSLTAARGSGARCRLPSCRWKLRAPGFSGYLPMGCWMPAAGPRADTSSTTFLSIFS